jgi:hypothetical protein
MCALTVATGVGSGNGGPQPNPVTLVAGTGPINPDLSGLTAASGVATSAGASIAVVSNIPTDTGSVSGTIGSSMGLKSLTAGATKTNDLGPVVTVLATVTAGNNVAPHSLAPGRIRSQMSLWFIIGVLTIALAAIT